jgi:hypothetical protein
MLDSMANVANDKHPPSIISTFSSQVMCGELRLPSQLSLAFGITKAWQPSPRPTEHTSLNIVKDIQIPL